MMKIKMKRKIHSFDSFLKESNKNFNDMSLDDLYQTINNWEDEESGSYQDFIDNMLRLVKNWEKLNKQQQQNIKMMLDQGDLDDLDEVLSVLQEKGIEIR